MVETQLTPDLVREGAVLIQKLDQAGVPPVAAFWLYSPDTNTWTLFLADARVGSEGPRVVYRAVQKALRALRNEVTHLSLEDVAVEKPDAPLVALLSRAIRKDTGIGGVRFSRTAIDGHLIDDAYVYRLKRTAA